MISENVAKIQQRIAGACQRSGRSRSDVTLTAVSKTFPASAVSQAVDAGIMDIGENYVQELLQKRESVQRAGLRWHFIGHLQSNKVRQVAEWIHLVHALESLSLAKELDRRAAQANRVIGVLVEVNTTGESSKFGIAPAETLSFIRSLRGFDHLLISGLMTIGPFLPDPEASRPMFRTLRQLKEECSGIDQGNVRMQHLSMGMTGDFEVAIEEGATIVRIGTALFGARTRQDSSPHP